MGRESPSDDLIIISDISAIEGWVYFKDGEGVAIVEVPSA